MERRQRLEPIHRHAAYPTVERVILTLSKAGFEAVLAGGSVRDAVLGVSPKDFDIATSALPEDVERLFPVTLAVGKIFGTIVVVENGFNIEVTTFRTEGGYQDGRRPSHVEFSNMEEDAKRRDFTVNALFYDPLHEKILDFAGGLKDLDHKILRTVGVASERFGEDHLRMLRAARFVSQLGFSVEDATLAAIESHAAMLSKVSSERVLNEMQRLLTGPFAREGLRTLMKTHLHQVAWPEIAHLEVEQLNQFPAFLDWENAFAAAVLLTNTEPETRLRSWKVSRDSLKSVKSQIDSTRVLMNSSSSRVARILALGTSEYAQVLVLATGMLSLKGQVSQLDNWIKEYLEVAGPNGELPKPLVSGEDLLAQGVPQSEKMGKILKALFESQLDGKIKTREQALAIARSMGDGSVI